MNKDEIAGLVKYARDWPGVEGDALSAGVVGQKLNGMANALTTLSARVETLEGLLDRMCDAYKLVCDDSGLCYYQSPGSVYAHCRQALGGNNG